MYIAHSTVFTPGQSHSNSIGQPVHRYGQAAPIPGVSHTAVWRQGMRKIMCIKGRFGIRFFEVRSSIDSGYRTIPQSAVCPYIILAILVHPGRGGWLMLSFAVSMSMPSGSQSTHYRRCLLQIIIPRDSIQQSAHRGLFCTALVTGWYASFVTSISYDAAMTVIPTSCEPHHLRLVLRSHRLKQVIYPDHLHSGSVSTCGAGRFGRFLLDRAAALNKNG